MHSDPIFNVIFLLYSRWLGFHKGFLRSENYFRASFGEKSLRKSALELHTKVFSVNPHYSHCKPKPWRHNFAASFAQSKTITVIANTGRQTTVRPRRHIYKPTANHQKIISHFTNAIFMCPFIQAIAQVRNICTLTDIYKFYCMLYFFYI